MLLGHKRKKPRAMAGLGCFTTGPATIGGAGSRHTNQLADGEIIIRTICSRATMVSPIASLLSVCLVAWLRGANLGLRRVGVEPTPALTTKPA